MLTNEEKDRIATYRPHYVAKTSNELLLELKLGIALAALEEIDQECLWHDTTAWSIANNALQEIEEVK